jgi:hypothetical protein
MTSAGDGKAAVTDTATGHMVDRPVVKMVTSEQINHQRI